MKHMNQCIQSDQHNPRCAEDFFRLHYETFIVKSLFDDVWERAMYPKGAVELTANLQVISQDKIRVKLKDKWRKFSSITWLIDRIDW